MADEKKVKTAMVLKAEQEAREKANAEKKRAEHAAALEQAKQRQEADEQKYATAIATTWASLADMAAKQDGVRFVVLGHLVQPGAGFPSFLNGVTQATTDAGYKLELVGVYEETQPHLAQVGQQRKQIGVPTQASQRGGHDETRRVVDAAGHVGWYDPKVPNLMMPGGGTHNSIVLRWA